MMTTTAKIATRKTIPAQNKNMIEKLLSLTTESWNDIFQVVSVVAAAVAFVALVGTVLTGRKAGQRQAEKILTLGTELEKERRIRLELEGAIAPRQIAKAREVAENLRQFTGTKVIIESQIDAEAWRTANEIHNVLWGAGWEVVSIERSSEEHGFVDGVLVQANLGVRSEDDRSWQAANSLNDQLNAQKIDSHVLLPMKSDDPLPLKTVRVRVGFKPSATYFWPEEEKKWLKRMEEQKKRREKARNSEEGPK
jgi:hypothetical protein